MFDMVIRRLGISVSYWKKQFFHESIDEHICYAEVKINKLMKSNIKKATKLTEYMFFFSYFL